MTRADFWAVANVLAAVKADTDPAHHHVLREAAHRLASACAGQHSGMGFNRPLFLKACGFPAA